MEDIEINKLNILCDKIQKEFNKNKYYDSMGSKYLLQNVNLLKELCNKYNVDFYGFLWWQGYQNLVIFFKENF